MTNMTTKDSLTATFGSQPLAAVLDKLLAENADLRQQVIFITTHDARTSTRLAQAEARVRWLEAALHKVLDEAHGDCDRAAILAAARGALVEDE